MTELQSRSIEKLLNENAHDLYIMTLEQFNNLKEELSARITLDNARTAAGYVAPANDIRSVAGIVREFGVFGKVIEKNINGRRYIILKGTPGLRQQLKGTRYLAKNPKILSMAIGQKGVNQALIGGARLTVVLTVPISILKWLISERRTLSMLIGTIASDLVKLGISTALGAAASMVAGTITTLALGPLIAAIVVGVGVAVFVESVDQKYGLTKAFIQLLEEAGDSIFDSTIGALNRQINRLENILRWQAKNDVPVGKGIFY